MQTYHVLILVFTCDALHVTQGLCGEISLSTEHVYCLFVHTLATLMQDSGTEGVFTSISLLTMWHVNLLMSACVWGMFSCAGSALWIDLGTYVWQSITDVWHTLSSG
jgi:hypothetical protein